tara:strand:+ start:409 stop:912 length:504 start_codon:yes stop_codon:yes gene_type:complete
MKRFKKRKKINESAAKSKIKIFKQDQKVVNNANNWMDSVTLATSEQKEKFATGLQLACHPENLEKFMIDSKAYSAEDAKKIAPVLSSGASAWVMKTGTAMSSAVNQIAKNRAKDASTSLTEEDITFAKRVAKDAAKLMQESGFNRKKERQIRNLIRERIQKMVRKKK